MQITVTGRHFEITDALRQHIEAKIQKMDRYLESVVDVHVVLSVEKHRHIAEITLQMNGSPIRAIEETHDMYEAVDMTIEKLERQVRKHKEKDRDHKSRGTAKGSDLIEPEADVEEDSAASAPKVIRAKKKLAVKPMSSDEAAMQLGLLSDDFLAFLNPESNQLNVMYKRRDGNYGLIEPEF